jgi:hypothetical protein
MILDFVEKKPVSPIIIFSDGAPSGLPKFVGDIPIALRPGIHENETPLDPLLRRTPFSVDPSTFNASSAVPGFLEMQRTQLVAAASSSRGLEVGDLVALRLLRGARSAAIPECHSAPFCLALVPFGFKETEIVPFSAFHSVSDDALTGPWHPTGVLLAPLSAILCSGLELVKTPARVVPNEMSVTELRNELIARGERTPSGVLKSVLIERLSKLLCIPGSVDTPVFMGAALTKTSQERLRFATSDWDLGRALATSR